MFMSILARVNGDPGPMYPLGRVIQVGETAKALASAGTRDGTFRVVDAGKLSDLDLQGIRDHKLVWSDEKARLVLAPDQMLAAVAVDKMPVEEVADGTNH